MGSPYLGNVSASRSTTSTPSRASTEEAYDPAGPPPITNTEMDGRDRHYFTGYYDRRIVELPKNSMISVDHDALSSRSSYSEAVCSSCILERYDGQVGAVGHEIVHKPRPDYLRVC
nr:hypothetical protein CFP56_58114 [Quercus suber]